MATLTRRSNPVIVHKDHVPAHCGESTEDETSQMEESTGPLEESGGSISADDDDDDDNEPIEQAVLDDMERFEQSFARISSRFRLINRIGEGTFSTVYKAEDLHYEHYQNDWDMDAEADVIDDNISAKPSVRKPRYVAIKKIYVTSSPSRILNELELLHDLRNSPNVCPLITAFRHQDQVIAILPFFQHKDFRDYYRELSVGEMRIYFQSLFTAVAAVHECEIIHRDIKPTNFLYSPVRQKGVLVDFGLAEREGTDFHQCNCCLDSPERQRRFSASVFYATAMAAHQAGHARPAPAYPKDDQRSSRRANRAGTRGFRAPEVLLKCTAQTCEIDVWSCGVILLTLLSRRFPFFHSADDVDAFLELCTVFGRRRMKEAALLHGQVLQTNIPTISDNGHSLEKILLWCTGRSRKDAAGTAALSPEESDAVEFLRRCLELDPARRISAEEALRHPWLTLENTSPAENSGG